MTMTIRLASTIVFIGLQETNTIGYYGGAFVRLYPANPRPTRNHAAKTKRRPRVRYTFALDIWGLMSVPYSRLKSPRM
jgi:hypothetical protein